MLNQFKTALLVWLQSILHSFPSSLCWTLPKHFRNNYVYFCEYAQKPPSLFVPSLSLTCSSRYASICCVCAFACASVRSGVSVWGLCVQDWETCSSDLWGSCVRHRKAPYTITGLDCSPARLVLHMRRRERREGGGGGGKIFPSCPLLFLSFPLPIHPAFSLLKQSTFATTPTLSSLLCLSVGPCPLFNSNCGMSTCTLTRAQDI